MLHYCLATWCTVQVAQAPALGCLHACRSKTRTARITTTTTVSLGQYLRDLFYARILPNSKLLGGKEKHHSGHQPHHAKYDYRNKNCIHNVLYLIILPFIAKVWFRYLDDEIVECEKEQDTQCRPTFSYPTLRQGKQQHYTT
jgi:hypothetical protein